jgi:hypothetical protein
VRCFSLVLVLVLQGNLSVSDRIWERRASESPSAASGRPTSARRAGLAGFVETLSDAQRKMNVPKDGRTVGVVVHHVASVYPLEIQLAETVAGGKPVAGVTRDAVADLNAKHAVDHQVDGAPAIGCKAVLQRLPASAG